MIEKSDASRVVETLAANLRDVSRNIKNFERLPDRYWGYFAKGHDAKGKFGVILAYSESGDDIDRLIKIHEEWIRDNLSGNERPQARTR